MPLRDEDLAVAIAELAGSILVDFLRTSLWSGAARGRFAETIVNRIILGSLKAHRPADPVISEEGDGGDSLDFSCFTRAVAQSRVVRTSTRRK